MEKGWVKIESASDHQIELKCALLKGHGLAAVVINKQDSSYRFGDAELYVKQDDVIRAKRILDEENV